MKSSASQIKTVYVVIFALLINAISSTGALAALNSGTQSVLLCTSQGYKWVTVDSETPKTSNANQHCKACLFPQNDTNSDDFIGSEFVCVAKEANQRGTISATDIVVHHRTAYSLAQGRAPPTLLFTS